MAEEIVDVDITAPDAEWLARFARSLVADRLAASANLSTDVRSIFWWQGSVRDEPEARVVLHTRESLVPAVLERVRSEHPYEVPGVRVVPVRVPETYRQWVLDSTDAG